MNVLTGAAQVAAAYEHDGPFVTVYLDATRSTEGGAHEVAVRWRDVREGLTEQDADGAALDAIETAIDADAGTPGPHGLVLVAAAGQLCLVDALPAPPAQSWGTVAPLPHLMPYLAQRAAELPHVVVVADRTGADVLAVTASGTEQAEVEGERQYPIHRTASADWSERHFQAHVENNWATNARDVADAVARIVRSAAIGLVIVAGDVGARHLIADDVAAAVGPDVEIRTVEEGGRAPGSSTAALEAAVRAQVLRTVWRRRHQLLEHLADNLGRGAYAVAGPAEVAAALRMSQADTVVVSDEPSSTLRAWIGAAPSEFGLDDGEAVEPPVAHDRYDAALVRAVVGTGAKLEITPGAHHYLPGGIGALLRYETAP